MTKKFFIVLSVVFALVLASSSVFAMDAVGNVMSGVGNQIHQSWNKMGDSAQSAGNTISDGFTGMMENGRTNSTVENTDNNTNNDGFMGMNNNDNNGNGDYTAERTSTEGTILGMDGTMWTWFVFAILGIVVISLVWYYGMQQTDAHKGRHED